MKRGKMILCLIASMALFLIVTIVLFVSPRDPAIRNQTKVSRLLLRAHPDVQPGVAEIQRIILGDGTALVPGRDRVLVGYVLRANVHSSAFTIGAQPVKLGVTGVFTYFRDESGVVRFEMDGKSANAMSRPLGSLSPR